MDSDNRMKSEKEKEAKWVHRSGELPSYLVNRKLEAEH